MLVGKHPGVPICLVILALSGGRATSLGQTVPAGPPAPEAVAKLIAQLGAPDFRSRQEASTQLEKLGAPALPALRKAARAKPELEVRRRIERLVSRIESALLRAEEERWQHLDAPRRALKERLLRILARAPALSDRQAAAAVYLLALGRAPTHEEGTRAQERLAGAAGRARAVLVLARSLAQGKDLSADLAAASRRLLKAQEGLATGTDLAATLARLNGEGFQKTATEVVASLDKAVKADEQLVDAAFLLVLSRFPDAKEARVAAAHLKKGRRRAVAAADIVWALMNTREFVGR
jgi:hypothetical protein